MKSMIIFYRENKLNVVLQSLLLLSGTFEFCLQAIYIIFIFSTLHILAYLIFCFGFLLTIFLFLFPNSSD